MTIASSARVTGRVAVGRVSFGRVLHSEWIKFVTLRSNLPLFGVVAVGLAVMGMLPAIAARADSGLSAGVAAQDVLGSISWLQLLVALPAVVFIAAETASAAAKATFLAVPKRIPVLLAKQVAVAVPAAVAGILGAVAAIAGSAILLDEPPEFWLAAPMVVGAGLYLATIAALAVAVAAIIRNVVGGVLTVAALLTIAPMLVAMIPITWVQRAAAWLPTSAGQLVYLPDHPEASLTWWGGFLVLLAWTAGATIVAAVLLRTRDV